MTLSVIMVELSFLISMPSPRAVYPFRKSYSKVNGQRLCGFCTPSLYSVQWPEHASRGVSGHLVMRLVSPRHMTGFKI